jgi:hypothetical protein
VLVYYANETAPDETESHNYETFIRWLETSHVEKARNTAESLRRDMRLFRAAVDLETYTLRHMLPGSGSRAGAVLFTNRLVRSGKFLQKRTEPRHSDRSLLGLPNFSTGLYWSRSPAAPAQPQAEDHSHRCPIKGR